MKYSSIIKNLSISFINISILISPILVIADTDSSYVCEVRDPYEKVNRVVYKFNSTLDYYLLRPVAIIYDKTTNNYVKNRVGSFIENINTPISTVNHALQFKFDNTMTSLWRFMINSTLGVGGLFDVATKVGIRSKKQGFGDTLGSYGVKPGPYIVIPLYGGTSARGIFDTLFGTENFIPHSMVATRYKLAYTTCRFVHARAVLLPFTDHIMENSLDPYISIRSSILQNQESSVTYPDKSINPIKK